MPTFISSCGLGGVLSIRSRTFLVASSNFGGFMAGPDLYEDATFLMTLHDFPDVAREIGHFVCAYSGLEISLWKLYGSILGADEAGAIELLGGIQSFTHKLDAIDRFLEHSTFGRAVECREILTKARDVNTFRVSLMHGLYGLHTDGTLWLHVSRTDPTRSRRKIIPLVAKSIEAETKKTFELAKSIYVKFFGVDPDKTSDIPLTLLGK
ncbi:MAG: hypothetical protein QOD74_958 [Variibacter sp.]|nr:hypothetical protein [Variibacter sp.]